MKHNCPYLSQFPHLKHGFFAGSPQGFSKGDGVLGALGETPLPLITLKQVHGDKVWQVKKENGEEVREGDGLITTEKNVALGIFTADCGPILFYEPDSQVVAACHAGWRGARAGIVQETLRGMEKVGAVRSRIYATLGPTIQQHHYEVGPEFPEEIGEDYATYFYPSVKAGHHYFNLPLYIQTVLLNEGIAQVNDLQIDTFNEPFLSRRRALSEGHTGFRDNLSVIAMT